MIRNIFILFALVLLASCEEVIEADVNTAAPRLVVEASIDKEKGTPGNYQVIKLSTTTGYYSNDFPMVNGAEVYIINSTGARFDFTQQAGTGNYICDYFEPRIGETYTLTVNSDGQSYTATETMYAAPDIKYYSQTNEGGFLGESIEIRYYYDDFPGERNFYMSQINAGVLPFPEYDIASDEFFEGNEMFEIFSDEDLKQGDVINIKLYGVSERYYNFMNILLDAAGGSGNPFQAVPVTARGNVVNTANPDNYALGYFRVCEVTAEDFTLR